jgi:membrane protease YdiL (CAAX protease family)
MNKNPSTVQRVLNVWAIVLIIWSVYRTKLALPEWFDELIAKPIVFILPVYYSILRYEQKPFFQQIWLKKKTIVTDIYTGLLVGFIFLIAAFFSNYLRLGNVSFLENIFTTNLVLAGILTMMTAISEEILSRGFILKRLYEDSSNMYSSSFIASTLFLVLHIPILFTIPNLSGSMLLLFMTTDFILSLVNSFIFLDRKSLLAPILIHALYNFAILFYR